MCAPSFGDIYDPEPYVISKPFRLMRCETDHAVGEIKVPSGVIVHDRAVIYMIDTDPKLRDT